MQAGYLSSAFDIGGILGGIIAGAVSDFGNGRALTSVTMLTVACPVMYIYHEFGYISVIVNGLMLVFVGKFNSKENVVNCVLKRGLVAVTTKSTVFYLILTKALL